jgi:hypothetical protein
MRRLILSDGKRVLFRAPLPVGLALLVLILVSAGMTSCRKAGEFAGEAEAAVQEENVMSFQGNVKMAVGKYVFLPEIRGFDIVVQGGDTGSLVGKDVRGEGALLEDKPSILMANTIDMKDESGQWTNVFTRTEDVTLDDYLDLVERNEFPVFEELSYDKKDAWEDQVRAKVFGALEEEGEISKIAVYNEKDEMVGKIIVDGLSDFSKYYIQKLRLFDKFWFYVTIKETVEWRVRRNTKEMFHADVLFAGLF